MARLKQDKESITSFDSKPSFTLKDGIKVIKKQVLPRKERFLSLNLSRSSTSCSWPIALKIESQGLQHTRNVAHVQQQQNK